MVGFTLQACSSATVELIFAGLIDGFDYRKYGPTTPGDSGTNDWYSFPAVIDGNTATLSLNDSSLGDDTGVDGMIVDAGGPTGSIVVPTMPAPILALLALLMVGGGAVAVRRFQVSGR